MVDRNGDEVKVGDRVRFFGTGGGMSVYETDHNKRLKTYGTIVEVHGDHVVIQVCPPTSPKWERYSSDFVLRK